MSVNGNPSSDLLGPTSLESFWIPSSLFQATSNTSGSTSRVYSPPLLPSVYISYYSPLHHTNLILTP